MFKYYNPNPKSERVGDCVIRAISKALNKSWVESYIDLTTQGLLMCDMPSANNVWGKYLTDNGFRKKLINDACIDCYTVNDFELDHDKGTYILALNGHVVTVVDGDHYDTWDSGNEVPVYYFERR